MTWLDRVYREVDARASREDRAEMPARRALLAGMGLSALALVAGLLLIVGRGEIRPSDPPSIIEMIRGIGRLRGTCLAYAGLLLLAATPILRVFVMTGVYLRRRELFMASVSVLVLGLLALGLLLGTG